MTGPQFPPGPQPGSNGIGLFKIGISPIGEIARFDVWQTIISQYANSPIITRLIENTFEYIDQTRNIERFFDLVMNVDTAEGYGLDVWGRIVGVNRVLQVQTGSWFGFAEASPGSEGFNDAGPSSLGPNFGFDGATQSVFGEAQFGIDLQWTNGVKSGGALYSGDPLTSNYSLSDQAYRTLIFAKAAANITDGSTPAINRILMSLFPNRGNAYVQDGDFYPRWFGFYESQNAASFNDAGPLTYGPNMGFEEADASPFGQAQFGIDEQWSNEATAGGEFYSGAPVQSMQITYTFTFPLSAVELAIVQQSGVLPKPTGVAASVVII